MVLMTFLRGVGTGLTTSVGSSTPFSVVDDRFWTLLNRGTALGASKKSGAVLSPATSVLVLLLGRGLGPKLGTPEKISPKKFVDGRKIY